MPNLVKKFRVEVGLYEGQKAPPRVTRSEIYPAEDGLNCTASNHFLKNAFA